MGKIILASASPRRRDLLKQLNYNFEIVPSPYVEDHTRTDFSYDFIETLATNKVLAVVPLIKEPCIIIGADTVVVLDNEILGKPQDRKNAFDMLKSLSNKKHSVVTSVVVLNTKTNILLKKSVTSEVTFNLLTDEMIDYYVDNYKPMDKAGAYGIQEMPDGYIKEYTGSLENIIGLDTKTVEELVNKCKNENNSHFTK